MRNILMRVLLTVSALICPSLAFAQGGSVSSGGILVLSPLGRPIGGATVTVCAFGATGIPCSPTITVYTDPTLVTPALNPATSDGNGSVFVYAAPGTYTYSVTGTGITGKSFTATVSGSGGGNVINGGPASFNKLDNIIMVDGITYTGAQALQTAIQACSTFTNGCVVDARNPNIGVQTFTTNPFSGLNMPITIETSHYNASPQGCDVQYDQTAFFLDHASHFHWTGHGTVLCDTTTGGPVFPGGWLSGRMYATTGSITTGTNTLTVASATGLNVGSIIGIMGARGGDANEQTTLNATITAGATSFVCNGTDCVNFGFNAPSQQGGSTWYPSGYIQMDSEQMQCATLVANTYSNCTRGINGTAAAGHTIGVAVFALPELVTEVTGISGNTITVLDNASFTVTGALVRTGVVDTTFDGSILFQGSSRTLATGSVGYYCEFCSTLRILPGVNFDSWSFAAILQVAGRYNTSCPGKISRIGTHGVNSGGVGIWMFGGDQKNTSGCGVTNFSDVPIPYWLNDRSTAYQTFDTGSNSNVAHLGDMDNVDVCTNMSGFSTLNTTYLGTCNLSAAGAAIQLINSSTGGSGFWSTANVFPRRNTVYMGTVNSGVALITSNSYYAGGNNFNSFRFGDISNAGQSLTIPAGDEVLIGGGGIGALLQTITASAGWGTTATATQSLGAAGTVLITITANGTGIVANPTVTLSTFVGSKVLFHSCRATMVNGTGTPAPILSSSLASPQTFVFTYSATPVAAATYIFRVECGP